MRRLIATVFNYSLDGFLADEGTAFWDFCFSVPENANPDSAAQVDFLRGASAHVFGRTSYEGISTAMQAATDHPFSAILAAAPKVVFSRTLESADWANTTIARGDTRGEVEKLKAGDGYVIVWGGVGLWTSLMQLELLDELHVSTYPYIAGEGRRLFEGIAKPCQLDLVSSTASGSGVLELVYRRHA